MYIVEGYWNLSGVLGCVGCGVGWWVGVGGDVLSVWGCFVPDMLLVCLRGVVYMVRWSISRLTVVLVPDSDVGCELRCDVMRCQSLHCQVERLDYVVPARAEEDRYDEDLPEAEVRQ